MVIKGIHLIQKYIDLTEHQGNQLIMLEEKHRQMQQRVNLISRRDGSAIWTRHILHSLAISFIEDFAPGSTVLDIGTGGGFPTLPLAILKPEVHFHAIDGRSRKIDAVQEITDELGLRNVRPQAVRAEDLEGSYDIIMGRAVAPLRKLLKWSRPLSHAGTMHYFLKGGDLEPEIRQVKRPIALEINHLSAFFSESWFEKKYLLSIRQTDPSQDT